MLRTSRKPARRTANGPVARVRHRAAACLESMHRYLCAVCHTTAIYPNRLDWGDGKMLSIYFMWSFYPEAVSVTTNAPHLGILVRHVKDARMPCPLHARMACAAPLRKSEFLIVLVCPRREKIQPSGVCAAFLLPCQPLTSVPGCSFCLSVGQRRHLFSHMPVLWSASLCEHV